MNPAISSLRISPLVTNCHPETEVDCGTVYSVDIRRCTLRSGGHSVGGSANIAVAIPKPPRQASIFVAHSSSSVMSHVASAAHTTTTAFALRTHSKSVSRSIPRRCFPQRTPFVGDRVELRQPLQTRALSRSNTVCITKVDEAQFQEEVLKVGYIPVHARHCKRREKWDLP